MSKKKQKSFLKAVKSRWEDFGMAKPVTKIIPNKKRKIIEKERNRDLKNDNSLFFI